MQGGLYIMAIDLSSRLCLIAVRLSLELGHRWQSLAVVCCFIYYRVQERFNGLFSFLSFGVTVLVEFRCASFLQLYSSDKVTWRLAGGFATRFQKNKNKGCVVMMGRLTVCVLCLLPYAVLAQNPQPIALTQDRFQIHRGLTLPAGSVYQGKSFPFVSICG